MSVHAVAGDRLKRQLERSAEEAGCAIDWIAERSSPFTPPSFVGGQHRLVLLLSTPCHDDRRWLDDLDEHSFVVPGFVLAQLEVGVVEQEEAQWRVELEALTVMEA